jgi:hypothetical protein
MFADDTKVSKTMIKYACGIPKESIVELEGLVVLPANPIESATQKNVCLLVDWGEGGAVAVAGRACSNRRTNKTLADMCERFLPAACILPAAG